MSLLKLLTAGKSLVGLKDAESRYRMSNQKLLPKFGAAKNPFRPTNAAETAPMEAMPAAEAKLATPVVEDMPVRTGDATDARAIASAQENVTARASLLRLGALKCREFAAALQSRWTSQVGSFISRPARKPARPVAVPVPAQKLPMQGQLSLDQIKVMRNDLSDADLEVVSAKSKQRSVPAPKPAPAAQATTETPGRARERAADPVLSQVNR
jgi:hypothetical protein